MSPAAVDRPIAMLVTLARGDIVVATWPVTARADLDLVDELARIHLAARRLGLMLQVVDPSPALVDLLRLVGLADALLGVEPGRQTEQAEEARVEEVVVADDPVA